MYVSYIHSCWIGVTEGILITKYLDFIESLNKELLDVTPLLEYDLSQLLHLRGLCLCVRETVPHLLETGLILSHRLLEH
jgi:hypothetical protein